jgi:hypothetical protein
MKIRKGNNRKSPEEGKSIEPKGSEISSHGICELTGCEAPWEYEPNIRAIVLDELRSDWGVA